MFGSRFEKIVDPTMTVIPAIEVQIGSTPV